MRRTLFLLAWLSGVFTACGTTSGQPTPSSSPVGTSGTPATHADADWTTFMGDPGRSGVGPTSPAAVTAQRTWTAQVDGDVYAGPLVVGSSVIVATERNSVYALDAATGDVHWQARLGQPVARSQLLCGNIDPNGITATPVIDAAAGMVYAVAMLSNPLRHELFALRLSNGAIAWHRAADPPGADPRVHQQRGALNLAHGRIYFSYGGFTGDCGQYHGWVIAAPSDGTGQLAAWQVPAGVGGGIWAPPGPVISAAGDVWVSTGNTDVFLPGDAYDEANSVVRLDGALSGITDEWAPTNWRVLNQTDTDLGSMAPALLPDGLVFAAGKAGIGYLLRERHLGGIAGEAFRHQVCPGGPTSGAFGGAAVAGGMVFVPCKVGLIGVRINPATPSFTVAWQAAPPGANTPVVAYGLVWTISADPSGYRENWVGTLVGLDQGSGAVKVRVPLGAIPHFASPGVGHGSLYVGGQGSVYAVRVAS